MHRLLLCCLLLGAALAGWADAPAVTIPLVPDAAASVAHRQAALAAGRCIAVDLGMKTQTGLLLAGVTTDAVPAGNYRLHVPLALAPLGDARISAITITLASGETTRTVGMLHFAKADEFTDLTLDVTTREHGVIPYTLSWAMTGPVAEKNRLHLAPTTQEQDPDRKDDIGDTEPLEQDDAGTIRITDLPKLKYHLATSGAHVEPRSPVLVNAVTTDKIVYKPGERGAATVTLTNAGAGPLVVTLTMTLQAGLAESHPLATAALTLPAGGSTTWTGAFPTEGLHWGAEIIATAQVTGCTPARERAIFGVTGNPWETAIATSLLWRGDNRDLASAEGYAAALHAQGTTLVESYSWSPDDFGDFTPDTEEFFGGQCGYVGSIQGTKNTIAALHQHGIADTVYAFLYGGDGPPSIEMMRKHPDWFSSTMGPADYVEHWYLQATHKLRSYLNPIYTNLNRASSAGALPVHAAELVASHRAFGWDGVRYDSYYSDPWVKDATRRVRAQVQKDVPHFRWGYNSIVPLDVQADALGVMVGGGNLVMEEGIRWITNGGGAFSDYANTVITYRDLIWPHDGHLGVCYDPPRFDAKRDGNALDALYLSTILLASGVHPYYGRLEEEIGQHTRFALRYSDFLYNNAMRPLQNPEATITFGQPVTLLEWERLARTVNLGGDRRRLILHLLNAPVVDQCMRNPGVKTPAPLRNLPISVNLPAGATVDGAWLLAPVPTAHHAPLVVTRAGNAATITVPEVRFWGVVVIDYRAPEGIPSRTTMTTAEAAFMAKQTARYSTPPPPAPPKMPRTDEEEATVAKVVAPAEWAFPRAQPPRVLAIHGYWYREYALERALARLGGARIEHSWEAVPSDLRYHPETYDGLMGHHVVVIANVNAEAFGPVRRKMLKDYVAHGGSVLFLGGWYAFGPGYHHSLFEEMAPVTFPAMPNPPPNQESLGVWHAAPPGGLPLTPGKDLIGAGFAGLNWAQSPRVFWYHALTPKAGAKVLLTAGGKPLLITGTYGKGRVAVFAGSVMGDPPAGVLPFWRWNGWPTVLAQTVLWLAENPARPVTLGAPARAALAEQLLGVGVKSVAEMTPALTRAAHLCGEAETAKIVLEGVAALDDDAPASLVDLVGDAVGGYVDGTFAPLARKLLDSGQTQKTSLGLRILGRAQAPGARAELEQAVQSGEVTTADDPEHQDDPVDARAAIRLGALEGLSGLGDPAALPLLRATLATLAPMRSKTEDVDVYLISQDDELYLQTALAALRCGDPEIAGTVIDTLLAHQYIVARQRRMLDYAPDEFEVGYKIQQAFIRRQYDRVAARQQQWLGQLAALPPGVLPALAQRIARETDPLVVPMAFAAFHNVARADVLTALKTSPLPAVADLARRGR